MKTRDGIVSVKDHNGRTAYFKSDCVIGVDTADLNRDGGPLFTRIALVDEQFFTKMPKHKVLRLIGWDPEKHAPWLEFNDTKPTWWDTHLALIKDEQRILAIRHIREETGLGLKEAKAISDRVVDLLKAGVIP